MRSRPFDLELAGPGSSNRGDRFSASESRQASTGGDQDLARAIGTTNATSRKVRAYMQSRQRLRRPDRHGWPGPGITINLRSRGFTL